MKRYGLPLRQMIIVAVRISEVWELSGKCAARVCSARLRRSLVELEKRECLQARLNQGLLPFGPFGPHTQPQLSFTIQVGAWVSAERKSVITARNKRNFF